MVNLIRLTTMDDRELAEKIIDQICRRYKVTREEMFGGAHKPSIAHPRLLAMYLVREKTSLTLKEIGVIFHKEGQGTVWKAWRRIKDYKFDPSLRTMVESLIQQTESGSDVEVDVLEKLTEKWRNLAQKLRWRAMSDSNKGDAKKSTMNMTTAGCLEMCAEQVDNL